MHGSTEHALSAGVVGTSMVASAHPLASQVGVGTLANGGNAFDAAVAVAAALNVVEPFMSGLAGMGYATMWVAAEQRVRVLDFVPPIPRSFPAERFHARAQLARGQFAVAPLGNLSGWCKLRDTYGVLPLAQLLEPAAQLAEAGFAIGRYGAGEINEHAPGLAACPIHGNAFRANYPCAQGIVPGDTIRQPDLARTLRQIAAAGEEAVYRGPLGERIVDHLATHGGTLTVEDLAQVTAVWREPVAGPYRGLVVHVPPPPCEGFQALLTLRILDGFDLRQLGHGSAGHLDLMVRAVRLAASVRIANGCPDEVRLAGLLSDRSVNALRSRLRAGEATHGQTEQWAPLPPGGEGPGHTTSFSVADRDGNMVCVTQSLGSVFGSGVVVPGTGICLNNLLYWADVQPGSPNRACPGGPLPMCMAPSISTRDGVPELALGTPGSYGILQTQPQALVNHIDFGMPLQAAIDAPRGRAWDGGFVEFENRIPPATIRALRSMGHDARPFPSAWTMKVGGIQAIRRDRDTGLFTGAADARRDGAAVPL